MIHGTCIMYSTDYGVGVTGNYGGGAALDCQVLRAPQYLNPALISLWNDK